MATDEYKRDRCAAKLHLSLVLAETIIFNAMVVKSVPDENIMFNVGIEEIIEHLI